MPRSGAPKERPAEPLTPPPSYGHQPQTGSGESSGASGDKDHLYSTVCKPRSPKPAAPAAPPFSSSSGVLGTGLCELDRLLQELNATQFNITALPARLLASQRLLPPQPLWSWID
ncbi:TGFB1I1 isoform 17 [Pan troglodytes]|uniref:Transforming growth factor beta 1 induced transcript 1 n=3 Tax=Homininae TaxID=207598 RepID=H3BN49_HUMAN|nr:transforming growth factor beta 1 induced transcript 1 [Homo sapiens]KAI4054717.1 transforming growth factor beta 1 induced transcript 1 [Homo sapiens]PNI17927.1 TGFB1I1 isoform 17 [Pan troglodytes]